MHKKIKLISIAAALICAGTACLSGCGKKTVDSGSGEQATLRYWMNMTSHASTVVNNMGDTPLMKKLQEVTGIKISFEHPPQGQTEEKFNLLVASDDCPDIIQYNWIKYPGGPEKAIKDKIIVDINEYKDHAPNLFKYLDENKEIKKLATTDSGALFSFPFVRGDDSLLVSYGLIIREDWLKDLGLEMPETIDDWETTLRAFRDKKGAQAPLSVNWGSMRQAASFVGAYGTTIGYYVDDGKIKYGMTEPGFKDFITLMNKWYKEGLLDNNYATLDQSIQDSNILNGITGVVAGSLGQGIGRYMNSKPDDKFSLNGAPIPVKNKGDVPEFGAMNVAIPSMYNTFAAISVDSKHKEEAAKLLDYGYSDEGRMLFNFGIEGESYEMIDGYPTYTEKITNNPDGLAMTVALSQYTYAYDAGPTIQDKRYMEQYAALPQQKEAWEIWERTNMKKHVLPHLYVKENEVNELASLENAVSTYADEMCAKMIMGTEPLENYDNVVAQLKERGLDRILEMKQSAYERYLQK